MFNYTREIIINKPISEIKRVNGSKVILERVGEYDTNKILKIYHTAGTYGSPTTLVLKGSDFKTAAGSLAEATYNVHLFVKTMDKYLADYANANWGSFGKSIVVEFTAKTNTAASIATALYNALDMATKDLDKMFTMVDDKNGTVTLTFEPYLTLGSENIDIKVYEAADKLKDVVLTTTPTEAVAPFGTYDWLVENLRFPSYPNVRYAAKNSDEYPMAGKLYDMVSFQYAVERPGLGGLSAVGQKVESVTTHVMYVPQDQAVDLVIALGGNLATDATKVVDANATTDKAAIDTATKANETNDKDDYEAETK